MVAQAVSQQAWCEYVRAFNARRDLAALASLIEIAFQDELGAVDTRVVHNLRQMSAMSPAMWFLSSVGTSLSGFVWVERGQLLGNVSVNESPHHPGTWIISNVAVLPEYRRRGIASTLVDTAIAHVQQRRGWRIILQVRADNNAALPLYQRRGFVTYDTLHELDRLRDNLPLLSTSITRRSLRTVHARDQSGLYRLVLHSTPSGRLLREPVHMRDFRRGLFYRLRGAFSSAFGARERYELVGEHAQQIVAYGAINVALLRGPHEVELHVLPKYRGHWEIPLLERLLHDTRPNGRFGIRATLSSSHPEALEAAQELGFYTTRVLDQMSLEISYPGR